MKVVAKVLYGSQNYGLAAPESDEDFKLMMLPSFDDLYRGRNLNEKRMTPTGYDRDHYSTLDVRYWFELLKKGNINAVEYLFSINFECYDESLWLLVKDARRLYREGYVKNVWATFFSSAEGVALNALKRNGVTKKTLSRAYYYVSLLSYMLLHNAEMDFDTWRSYDVTALAREIRFTVTGDTFIKYMTEEQFKNYFSSISKDRFTPDFALATRMDDLQKNVYNYIKGEILNGH